ncbi:MAG: SH3 domain-containing protein [Chloroflexota bacterium]
MYKKLTIPTHFLFIALIWLLSGCTSVSMTFPNIQNSQPNFSSQIIGDLASNSVPENDSITPSTIRATVITQGSRANLREGPGLEFPIIGKGSPQSQFDIVGRSEDGEWWQICCTSDESEEYEAGLTAWVASTVISIAGSTGDVPTSESIYSEDLFSRWDVEWECGSSRCEISECTATVEASVGELSGGQWLRMDHRVLWDETCFSTDEWVFEVNRFTGLERNYAENDSFLYQYWQGPQLEEAYKIYELKSGGQVAADCSGPYEVEVEEGEGWTTVYQGYTCHERDTGMLLSLSYEKRWLFTGEFEGQSYEREYFNDYERMEQNLVETTAQVVYLDETQ